MRAVIGLLGIILIFISCNNDNRGWSASDRKSMIDECVKAAKGGLMEDQARSYCECMQPKLEARYPKIKDVKKVNAADMQNSPELQEEALKCLGGDVTGEISDTTGNSGSITDGWTKTQRDLYIRSCTMAAKQGADGMDSTLAQSYCECMTSKIEKKFTFMDANDKISAALETPEWQAEVRACLGQ